MKMNSMNLAHEFDKYFELFLWSPNLISNYCNQSI